MVSCLAVVQNRPSAKTKTKMEKRKKAKTETKADRQRQRQTTRERRTKTDKLRQKKHTHQETRQTKYLGGQPRPPSTMLGSRFAHFRIRMKGKYKTL
jgi:hypothetical protein